MIYIYDGGNPPHPASRTVLKTKVRHAFVSGLVAGSRRIF
jgi:hypothetical protein